MDYLVYLKSAPIASFIFIIILITSLIGFSKEELIDRFILNPYRLVRTKEYYRIFTSTLIHGNFPHLLFNLITFYFFVFYFEKELVNQAILKGQSEEIGHLKFLLIYIFSIVFSTITTIYKHKDHSYYNALGASGAISGILFGLILFIIHRPELEIRLFFILPIPTWLFAILYLVYSSWAAKNSDDHIGHEVHLWGALGGLIITLILEPQQGPKLIQFIQYKFGLN